MQPADLCECVNIIAANPVIGPRYGTAVEDLSYVWRRLGGSAAMTNAVFEQQHQKRQKIVGFGVSVFVTDEFVREIKTPPLRWFGPELAKRAIARDSPILSDKQVRDANSGGGLNQLVWESAIMPEVEGQAEFDHVMLDAFIEIHRGFRFKELITSQSWSVERIQWVLDTGGLYWNPARQIYEKAAPEPTEIFAACPYVMGITRELELARHGSWVGTVFDYHAPRFGLSRSEQQLLLAALACFGGTDQEVARGLRLSVPTVKKMWNSIYRRVNACDSELILDSALAESGTHERGREKKRSLLAYVDRQRPEMTGSRLAERQCQSRELDVRRAWDTRADSAKDADCHICWVAKGRVGPIPRNVCWTSHHKAALGGSFTQRRTHGCPIVRQVMDYAIRHADVVRVSTECHGVEH